MKFLRFCILFFLFSFDTSLSAEEWKVTGLMVKDGNCFEVAKGGQIYRVYLSGVRAPYRSQPFAHEARQALKNLVYGKEVTLKIEREDTPGRLIARVNVGSLDVAGEMVKGGFAWADRKYVNDPALVASEDTARQGHVGLWSEDNPVSPWEYRHKKREARLARMEKHRARIRKEQTKEASTDEKERAVLTTVPQN